MPGLNLGTGKMELVPPVRELTVPGRKQASKAVITAQHAKRFARGTHGDWKVDSGWANGNQRGRLAGSTGKESPFSQEC